MAGIPGSKKVSRAARTGGSSRRKGESPLGFYALLVVIVVGGSLIVGFSRHERVSATTANNTPPLEPFTNSTDSSKSRAGDHWYEAYGIYICDKFVGNFDTAKDPYGVTTQNDGVLYAHPYEKKYAGKNATLGLFSDAIGIENNVGFELKEKSIKVGGDNTTYIDGKTKCGNDVGKLVVKEWADAAKKDGGKVLDTKARNVRVKNNGAVVIAFVPEAKVKDLTLPESATNGVLKAAAGKDKSLSSGADTEATPSTSAATTTPAAPETPVTTPAGGK